MNIDRLSVGEVWRTRVGGHPVHIEGTLCLRTVGFPYLGYIDLGYRRVPWAFSPDGRSSDPNDDGFDLIERIYPVPEQEVD